MAAEDRIIDKIKKLLALAQDDGATEGERDNALRMAHAFLAKHNLSMASLEEPEEERQRIHEEFYGRPWAKTVAHSVAKLFFCKYYIMSSGKKNMIHHYFVGKESNSITALGMARYLVDSIRKEAARQMRARGETIAWRRSFATGAANRIQSRVWDIQQAANQQKGSMGTGLVLADVYKMELEANEAWLKAQGTELTTSKGRGKRAGDGYHEGSTYGNSLGLQPQVSGALRIEHK